MQAAGCPLKQQSCLDGYRDGWQRPIHEQQPGLLCGPAVRGGGQQRRAGNLGGDRRQQACRGRDSR